MARGLSDFQKKILFIAYQNPGRDVRNREVLCQIYRFPIRRDINHIQHGSQIFNREVIGKKRYNACSVSVVKAFNRLCERRLAHRKYNHGIILSRTGIETAKNLKAVIG